MCVNLLNLILKAQVPFSLIQVIYLAIIDQVREFRARHWNFTKGKIIINKTEYIIKHSTHPVATGGSPIVTWLPNQLGVVLDAMVVCDFIQG